MPQYALGSKDGKPPMFWTHMVCSSEGQPVMRVVRRRNTANKKERRRTQSINNAYADLRDCIPNVPVDTKVSAKTHFSHFQ